MLFKTLIMILLLTPIQTIEPACPHGSFSHTSVTCNLYGPPLIHQSKLACKAMISSPSGEFASHFSPPNSICELLLLNASANGRLFRVQSKHAFIDAASSVKFFTCDTPSLCDPAPALIWSGVTWNPQSFPVKMRRYEFDIPAKNKHIKILLHTSTNSSANSLANSPPYASNTFELSWSNPGCMPCGSRIKYDEDWDPYIRQTECEQGTPTKEKLYKLNPIHRKKSNHPIHPK